jgi:PleD family two-component response regulator
MHELILVVDPDTTHLRKLREILSREGFNIMTATDRSTAIQICKKIPVQLVLGKAKELGFGECAESDKATPLPNEQ